MKTKNEIIKIAKISYIVSKILYCLSFLACIVFIILAFVLSANNPIESFAPAETGVFFGTLALYSFMFIGLLWNVESLFKSIAKEQAPFSESVSHYLKKIAIFIILVSVVPALVGSCLAKIVYPTTELLFPIELSGVIAGIVLFLIGLSFKYGQELQRKDDETL